MYGKMRALRGLEGRHLVIYTRKGGFLHCEYNKERGELSGNTSLFDSVGGASEQQTNGDFF